jgi:hypothetical protein
VVTGKDGSGLPPGEYRVSVELVKNRDDLFKGVYGQNNSPITCNVTSSSDDVMVDLSNPPKPSNRTRMIMPNVPVRRRTG